MGSIVRIAGALPIVLSSFLSPVANGVQAQELLADSLFDDSSDSAELRVDASGQDWYESRSLTPTLLTLDENVSAAWAQVENVYQRRMDLIPNLVETVKGYAAQEQETLTALAEARSRAGGVMQVDEDLLNDPEAFARFQQAQDGLGSALQRLLVVTENYPELKAKQNFLALRDQHEGTENRIAVERQRFNQAAQMYNTAIRKIPGSFIAALRGFEPKAYFQSTPGAERAPEVKF